MRRIPLRELSPLIHETFLNWQTDRAPRMGAALAYYVALSLAPTVVIVLAVTGLAFGARAAQSQLVWQVRDLVGSEGAKLIQSMIDDAHPISYRGMIATGLGLATLFFGGTAAVSELRDALNTIWRVPEYTSASHARSLFNFAWERLLSFGLVLGGGLFLLASLAVSTWISVAMKYLNFAEPPRSVADLLNGSVSFVLVTSLFAFLFKTLPAVRLEWADVIAGAVLTALLFIAGKLLLSVYLLKAGFAESYGTAGSLVVFLVWVYYSAQVVFLGAEFTRAYALRCGSHPQPDLLK